MIAFCQDKRRRDLVLQTQNLNGIDYIEVLGASGCGKQLAVTFLKDPRTLQLGTANFVVTGDTTPQVLTVDGPAADGPLTLTVTLDATGDFSPYALTLVTGGANTDPPAGVDRQLANVDFSFKAGCISPVDCLQPDCCPSPAVPAPDIHYLARDYDGFRQAMLDRIATLIPDWTEAHSADPGITMVEVLAYAADRVSYLQDAVNTEAYIGTAHSRISLRRHARLVDYHVQEGANARAWACLAAERDGITVPAGTQIYPLVPGLAASIEPLSYASTVLAGSPGPVFESLAPVTIYIAHNQMDFYTWGDGQCCMPAGTTEAWLNGVFPNLHVRDVLIFEEAMGPLTGEPADADPAHRWAVRLTSATSVDQSGRPLVDPVNTPPTPLTYIAWQSEDALRFPLCISSVTDADHGSQPLAGVSVAHGNVLAADHGAWIKNESLGTVPPPPPAPLAGAGCNCTGLGSAVPGAAVVQPYFRPVLTNSPLTFAVPFDANAAASTFLAQDISTVAPQITLKSDDGIGWSPVEDLLEEDGGFAGFIPEIEFDNTAHLRFGDGTYGAAPKMGLMFTATYRVGNGAAGNVGREALAHVLFNGPGIKGVRNPLAAVGGTDPETMEHIRQVAPFQFQSQLRCVTAQDYGAMAAALPGVAEAKGTMRWTGSWYTAFVSVEPQAGQEAALTSALTTNVTTSLNTLRMMGVDLGVEAAVLVGLRIGLEICVAPEYFQGDVYEAVWKVLVKGDVCTGVLGVLDPANFQFGETVYVSPIVAAAQAVTGVVAVRVVTFERMSSPTPAGQGPPPLLTMGRLEIPRCDNDPNHADRGLLVLTMEGGK
jgi:hypothetical protein